LAYHNRSINNPNHEDDLRQVVPHQIPVVPWRDDELTDLERITLLVLLLFELMALALLIHKHDSRFSHFAHHSDDLLLPSQDGPQLFSSVYLVLLLVPLSEQL
jgi:hypothetical protein